MVNKTRKRIDAIHSRIEKIALKGITNQREYFVLVDDLSYNGDYDKLLQCLYIYYNIDINELNTLHDLKTKTWKIIVSYTAPVLSKKLKKLYDTKGVYQVGYNFYKNDNTLLGEIIEDTIITEESKYYIKNREFSKLTGTYVTYLNVIKNGITTLINDTNPNISEDNNLYNRYVKAINLLLT